MLRDTDTQAQNRRKVKNLKMTIARYGEHPKRPACADGMILSPVSELQNLEQVTFTPSTPHPNLSTPLRNRDGGAAQQLPAASVRRRSRIGRWHWSRDDRWAPTRS